jgi:hypothetical protein
MNLSKYALIASLILAAQVAGFISATPASAKDAQAMTNIHANALHRLDFAVKGTSCPACLLKMQKRADAAKGVAKAAIMLRKPYCGVVIFDSSKTTKDELLKVLKGDEKKVSFEKVEDAAVDKMPTILIPHGSYSDEG